MDSTLSRLLKIELSVYGMLRAVSFYKLGEDILMQSLILLGRQMDSILLQFLTIKPSVYGMQKMDSNGRLGQNIITL